MDSIIKRADYFYAVAIAILLFSFYYDFSILWPENINWLLTARHDWGQHYLGWAFYREEPWTFPLGTINNFIYPSSTNIGFTDSIPLLALPFKLLSPILPDDFQYIGLWLLICYITTAFYSLKIFRLYNIDSLPAIIATILITGNPMLWYRGMHPALCAHGFIIASIYFYLKPVTAANAGAINRKQAILTVLTSLVHPYLTAMVIGFNFILPFRNYYYDRVLSLKKAILYPAITCVAIPLIWFIVGLLKVGPSERLGVESEYGHYGLNLNSLFNSFGFSSLVPGLHRGYQENYESYMYFGLGLGILVVVSLLYGLINGKFKIFKSKKYYPLIFLIVCTTFFAISNKVMFNDVLLFNIKLPQKLLEIGGIFRMSCRFFWITYYLMLFFFLIVIIRNKLPRWLVVSLLFAALAVQAYDVYPISKYRYFPQGTYNTPLDEGKWNSILKDFDRMIAYPPFRLDLLKRLDYQDLSFVAVKNNKAISTGYTARNNIGKNTQYLDSLTHSINNEIVRNNELYITTPEYLEGFSTALHNNKASVEYLDGYYLVYSKQAGRKPYFKYTAAEKYKLDSITALYSQTGLIKEIPAISYSNKIMSNVETLTFQNNTLKIKGWAFLKGRDNIAGDSVFVTVSEGNKNFLARTLRVKRPDVTTAFKAENLEASGFSATIFTEGFEADDIAIGLSIKSKDGQWVYTSLGRVKEMVGPIPQKTKKLPGMIKNHKGNVDNVVEQGQNIFINGWSAFNDRDAINQVIKLVLSGERGNYVFNTEKASRTDVTAAFENKYNLDDSGFEVKISKSVLPMGEYKVGILLINPNTHKQSCLETDKTIQIQ